MKRCAPFWTGITIKAAAKRFLRVRRGPGTSQSRNIVTKPSGPPVPGVPAKKKPLTEVRGEFKQGGFTSGRRRARPGERPVPLIRVGGDPDGSGALSGNLVQCCAATLREWNIGRDLPEIHPQWSKPAMQFLHICQLAEIVVN